MKKIINKTALAIILALSMVLALVGGLLFVKHEVESADADAALTKVDVTADIASFFPGATFTLTVTLQSSRENMLYNTFTFNIGARDAAKTGFDVAKCNMLEVDASSLVVDSVVDGSNKAYDNYCKVTAAGTNGFLTISATYKGNGNYAPSNVPLVFSINLKVKDDVAPGTDFDIGVRMAKTNPNRAVFRNLSNDLSSALNDTVVEATNPKTATVIASTALSFTTKTPSDNNNLASLLAGQGTLTVSDNTVDFTDPDNLHVTVKDPSSDLDIELTTEDAGATVKLLPGDVAVVDGKGSIAIPNDGIVTIVVTAENGSTKNYKLKVKVVGAMLTALTATPDSATTGVTKGLKETFASSTTEYTVVVPSDSTKVTITATVSTGNSAQTAMDVFTADSCTAPTTATSGTAFEVTNVSDGDKITITCKATDGTTSSSKDYELTFDVVDVNANLDSITVKGATTNQAYTNSATKATDKKVDYYYQVVGETNASSKVTVAAESSVATISIDSAAYNENATLTEGQHNLTITAEAGNSKTYTFFLKNFEGLEIKDGKVVDFLFEEEMDGAFFRRTYTAGRQEEGKEGSLVHGVDDVDFDRIVLGQIPVLTNVNAFLENFKDTSKIKLYTVDDELVYDLGSCAIADPDELDDADYYAIGTGWYIEYVVSGTVEETVYLSVLGDFDGDGKAGSPDASEIGKILRGVIDQSNLELEFRLAGYIYNYGEITADDGAALFDIIKKAAKTSDYFDL